MGKTVSDFWRIIAISVAGTALTATLTGCSLEDDRDLCCTARNTMFYNYRPLGRDEFTDHIHSMRHFLFAEDGVFLKEMPSGPDPQIQTLELDAGRYSMVTLANMQGGSAESHGSRSHISEFMLEATAGGSGAGIARGNTDELFWGVRHFDISADGEIRDFGPDRKHDGYTRPETEMNNIHCHLDVRVVWANIPEFFGDYEMVLSGVPTSYTLDPDSAGRAGGFMVPSVSGKGEHRLSVPLESYELNASFLTLRYSDTDIPVLRIFFGGRQVGPDIDLARAFREWEWRPSEVHVQEYGIEIRMYRNGKAEVSPMFDATISDWIDGGTFG